MTDKFEVFTGIQGVSMTPCSNCNGEGLVPKPAHYAPDGDDLQDICPYCLGDGFLYGDDYIEEEEGVEE